MSAIPSRTQALGLLWIFPLAGVGLAVANIWTPYSYWMDELYSVTASQQDLAGMFDLLLADVHPPLYQMVLWCWLRLFGDSEPATRVLSLVFALSALAMMAIWSRKLETPARVATLVLFGSSLLFSYYAQETRSYAMLLLLATRLTLSFLDYRRESSHLGQLLGLCILISLTHYFGLLLAAVVLAWLFFDNLKNRQRLAWLMLTGAVVLAWPVMIFMYGEMGSKLGGHFWIQVAGPLDSLSIALRAMAHSPGSLLLLLGLTLATQASRQGLLRHAAPLVRLAFLSSAVVALAVLIDLHTPVSTRRNYIILLPAMSILFGLLFGRLFELRRIGLVAMLLLAATGYKNVQQAHKEMAAKWLPLQNWKAAAHFLLEQKRPGIAYYHLPMDRSPRSASHFRLMNEYYLNQQAPSGIVLNRIDLADIPTTRPPYAIMFATPAPDRIEQRLRDTGCERRVAIHYPVQSLRGSTGVITPVE